MRKLYSLLGVLLAFSAINAQTTILSEGFEGAFPPTGWALVNAGTGNSWTQNTSATYASTGSRSMMYSYSETDAANAWAFSPALSLTSGTSYRISYFYRARSSSFPEKLKVTIGSAQTVASQTTTLANHTAITNTTFAESVVYYTAPSTGNFHLGFNAYSDPDEWNLYVDSVVVQSNVSAPPPPANNDCAAAVGLVAGVATNGSLANATQSQAGSATCPSNAGPAIDVWYKFTAWQNGTGTVSLTGANATLDAILELFSGSCGSLTSITCQDATSAGGNETLTYASFTSGQVYYLRVYNWEDVQGGTFTLNISGVALPVTMVNFKGERLNAINRLEWTTATEVNNNGFELQRSADGVNFSTLSFIASKASNGNSTSAINYSFGDVRPLAGTNYYRLKQIDRDGKSTLSGIVSIKGAKVSNLVFTSIYPNPVKDKLSVVITAPANDNITLIITDLAGKMIMQKATQVNAGDNNIELPVGSFGKGVYVIKAICSNGCETALQKFIKQ